MNEKSDSTIDPELEARIVAMVLGEASDFERDELQRLIDERPELAAFRAEIESVDDLLQEVAGLEEVNGGDDWKLPKERRQVVLATLDGNAQELSNVTVEAPDFKELAGSRSVWRRVLSIAALLGFLALGATLILPSVNESREIADMFPHLSRSDGEVPQEYGARISGRFEQQKYYKGSFESGPDDALGVEYEAEMLMEMDDSEGMEMEGQSVAAEQREHWGRSSFAPKSSLDALRLQTQLDAISQVEEEILQEGATAILRGKESDVSRLRREIEEGQNAAPKLPRFDTTRNRHKSLEQAKKGVQSWSMQSAEGRFDDKSGSNGQAGRFGDSRDSKAWTELRMPQLSVPDVGVIVMDDQASSPIASNGNQSGLPTQEIAKGQRGLSRQYFDHSGGGGMGGGGVASGRRSLSAPTKSEADQQMNFDGVAEHPGKKSKALPAYAVPSPASEPAPVVVPSKAKPAAPADGLARGESKKAWLSYGVPANNEPTSSDELNFWSDSSRGSSLSLADRERSSPMPSLSLAETSEEMKLPDLNAAGSDSLKAELEAPTGMIARGRAELKLKDDVAPIRDMEARYSFGGSLYGESEKQRRLVRPMISQSQQNTKAQPILSKRLVAPKGLAEVLTAKEPYSTFSLHVSDVSFKLARTALGQGKWPETDRIRVEEFVKRV